jgi:hypothetical protein
LLCVAALCAALPVGQGFAGEVHIRPQGDQFDFTVTVKSDVRDSQPGTPVENKSGIYVYPFDDSTFANSAYQQRVFVLTWKRRTPDVPALGVRDIYSIDIPVMLRPWMPSKLVIDAWPFDGSGAAKLQEYEDIVKPAEQWRKLLASLQLADHYIYRLKPPHDPAPEARRMLNAAITALSLIAPYADGLSTPSGLEALVRKYYEDNEGKRGSLLEAMRKVDELILDADLRIIEAKLRGSCDFVRQSFVDLARRREEIQRTYKLPEPGRPELDRIRQRMEQAACRTAGQ